MQFVKKKGGTGAKALHVMRKELEKILQDEKFVKELLAKETREEAKKAIEEKGVSVTDEEMEEMYQFYSDVYEKCKTMSKEDLDKIAGGGLREGLDWAINTLLGYQTNTVYSGGRAFAFTAGAATVGAGVYGVNKAREYFKHQNEEKQADKEHARAMEIEGKKIEQQKLALQNKQTNLLAGATVAAGIVGTGYLFRNEIKSWIKGHSK